jgi:hypothetical protein
MIQNTVQTLVDYVKDISGQTNATTAKIIRAMNFGVDHLSILGLLSGAKVNPDYSNHTDTPSSVVTTSDATLSTSGGDIEQDQAVTFRFIEVLDANGIYRRLIPIDERDEDYTTLQGQSGTPTHYDISGQTIKPLPVPDGSYTYRLTHGRVHPRYSASNLTQTTGLLPLQEEYVALYAADRIMLGGSDSARTAVRNEMTVMQNELKQLFALRDQNTPRRMKPKQNYSFTSRRFIKRTV